MEYFIDLHCHSVYSGGCLPPFKLIQRAKADNIKVLSLTDHNTVAGHRELKKLNIDLGVKIITGVELYVTYKKHLLHLLGYNVDINNKLLISNFKKLCQKRLVLVENSLAKLRVRGFRLKNKKFTDDYYPDLSFLTNQLVQSPNLTKTRGYTRRKNPDIFRLINVFFAKGCLAYLPEVSLPIKKAFSLIKKAGGVPVLAHPGQQLSWTQDKIIDELKKLGLKGLEVFSPYHNWHQIEHYQELAKKLKLVITGGSDFHCDLPKKNFFAKNTETYFHTPYEVYKKIKIF